MNEGPIAGKVDVKGTHRVEPSAAQQPASSAAGGAADTQVQHVDPQADLRRQYRLACRHWRAALQRLEDSGLSEEEALEQAPDFDYERFQDLRCGALARSTRQPCRSLAIVFGNGRCKLHGGMSTGPVSDAGKARAALNGNQPKCYPPAGG